MIQKFSEVEVKIKTKGTEHMMNVLTPNRSRSHERNEDSTALAHHMPELLPVVKEDTSDRSVHQLMLLEPHQCVFVSLK